ncbi:MAG: hypothetical protein WAK60_07515, partial [Sedimentisphaerales bacterium]
MAPFIPNLGISTIEGTRCAIRVIKFNIGINLIGPNFITNGRDKISAVEHGMTIMSQHRMRADSSAKLGNITERINGPANSTI